MLKNRILFLLGVVLCLYAACKQDPAYDLNAQAAIDENLIQTYIKANNINAVRGDSGLYYQIIAPVVPGTATINDLDTIRIQYVGRLTDQNKTVFDSTSVAVAGVADTANIKLLPLVVFRDVMPGWKIGLRSLQPGAKIRLIVPSTLGYQNRVLAVILNSNPRQFVPANSILDFNIQLFSVKKQVNK